ncbi:MAG: alpha/beta hydrolase [Actinobacteria bacterium]|nr:alpha/beta hydrolase [Actinomycetota bacterium]MBV9934478.1 alpha/beta hydrolase [Actinomycetota bacterium]
MPLLDQADWPQAHHTIASRDGTKLAMADSAGQGRPVLFVHGLGLTHEVWLPQTRLLRDRYRVLGLDTRGHGDSGPGIGGYSPTLFAEDIAAVLTALDLRDVVLVGHSLGGTNLGQFAVDHPDVLRDRVAGLIFVSTFAAALNGEGWWRQRFGGAQARAMASLMGRRKPPATPPTGRVVTAMTRRSFGGAPDPADVRRLIEIGTRTAPAIAAACTVGNLSYDIVEHLGRVQTPALVVVGSKDRTSPPRSARRLAAALPRSELVVLDGAGHPLGLQRPGELAVLIDRFAAGL